MKEKILFSWSGGKDSALALYEIQRKYDYEIAALLTTVTETYNRISMHGIREALLERQAEYLSCPLEKVFIPNDAPQQEYEAAMLSILTRYKAQGISSVIFGDIFLEDVRRYRENNLSKIGMKAVFPLWKRDTRQLACAFIKAGFKAVVTCVDGEALSGGFAGRLFDERFINQLPGGVDHCGENGEFHSFVYDGPIFRKAIPHKIGETCLRDNRFYYCDILPL